MNEQWVKDNLGNRVQGDTIVIDSSGQWIPITDFVNRFQGVANPNYETLKSAEPVEAGWPATFDLWHSEGLI